MKLVASQHLTHAGKLYRRGAIFSVAAESEAGALVRSGKARPAPGEIERYLSTMRLCTPMTPARGMKITRR
jgi:hypothetical protein